MDKDSQAYNLKCPQCQYKYKVVTFDKPVIEKCPICGHCENLDCFEEPA